MGNNGMNLREGLRALYPNLANAADEQEARRANLKTRMKRIGQDLYAEKRAEEERRQTALSVRLTTLEAERALGQRWQNPPVALMDPPAGTIDLSGREFGRLRVIRFHSQKRWLVRCLCGFYELCTTKIVLKADPNSSCQVCQTALLARQKLAALPKIDNLSKIAKLFDGLAEQARTGSSIDYKKLVESGAGHGRKGRLHWKAPPKPLSERPDHITDLTGNILGSLKVVGYYGSYAGHNRWVVRCKCGAYEMRRSIVILRANPKSRCEACVAADAGKKDPDETGRQ